MKVIDIAFDGLPQSKYSINYACPTCHEYYADYNEKIDVTYYRLPEPATIAGVIDKDGAVEVRCPCGTVWWCHIDIEHRTVERMKTSLTRGYQKCRINGNVEHVV